MTHSLFCSKALAFKNLAKKRQGSNKSKIELFSFLFLHAYNLGVRAGSKCLLTLYSYWSARCPATYLGEECLSLVSCSSLGGFLWKDSFQTWCPVSRTAGLFSMYFSGFSNGSCLSGCLARVAAQTGILVQLYSPSWVSQHQAYVLFIERQPKNWSSK